jgi:hypothetical protein
MDYDISDAAAELACWHAGVISRQQLLAAGLTSQMIATRLERGRWQQLHWVCTRPYRAASAHGLALGGGAPRRPGGVLSHFTAAELHGLLDPPAEAIFVTVPSTRRISVPGLVVRTSERIAEATQPGRQPPRTSVDETVLDLAQLAWTFDDACGWLTQACGRRLTTAAKLERAQQLRKKIRWRHELEDVLAAAADGIHSAPGSCGSAAGPASPGRARLPAPCGGRNRGDRFAEFTPIASTTTGGPASHLMRLGESGTPSLVFLPGNAGSPRYDIID